MAKRRLTFNQFETFHLLHILKNAKPRKKAVQALLKPIHENITVAITEVDPKVAIREAVIAALLSISGFPPPVVDAQPLSGMGFTPFMYAQLAAAMTIIIQHYTTKENVLPSEVSGKTVGGCVTIALRKAAV